MRVKGDSAVPLERAVDSGRTEVQAERVQQGQVVLDSRRAVALGGGDGDTVPQLGHESRRIGRLIGNVSVYRLSDLTILEEAHIVGADVRNLVEFRQRRDLGQAVDVEAQGDSAGEGAEDDIAKLNAVCRNGGTKPDVMLDQELGEVLEDDQEDPQSSLEEDARGLVEAGRLKERVQEFEQRHQDPIEIGPTL